VSALPEKAAEVAVNLRHAVLAIQVPATAEPMVMNLRVRDLELPGTQRA
jgi:hypothetical protein